MDDYNTLIKGGIVNDEPMFYGFNNLAEVDRPGKYVSYGVDLGEVLSIKQIYFHSIFDGQLTFSIFVRDTRSDGNFTDSDFDGSGSDHCDSYYNHTPETSDLWLW